MQRSPYFMTSEQAARMLGVSRATLYAYASRGQLRSERVPGEPRERRYHREDIERLKERKEVRRDPAKAAARGLHWGGPVLESCITLIHNGRFYYRGRDAARLAETATLEEAAALLWAVEEPERSRLFEQPGVLSARQLTQLRILAKHPLTQVQTALATAAAADVASHDLRPAALRQTSARILRLLTTVVARRESGTPIHRTLQAAWAPGRPAVAEVIRAALVLCADHELNVSAFVARCAASAGASPYDVVSAAMATLKGYKHGGAAERVLALVPEVDTPKSAHVVLGSRLRRGEPVPGFGHPLYPAGDPRAALLIRFASESGHQAAWRPFRHLLKAGTTLLGDAPNLDFGLAAVTLAYELPEQAPVLLFALGRTVGWMAHAIEAYASGTPIRPRARYAGAAPADDQPQAPA